MRPSLHCNWDKISECSDDDQQDLGGEEQPRGSMDRISECSGDCDDQDLGGEEQPRGSMDKVDSADVWRRNYATFM